MRDARWPTRSVPRWGGTSGRSTKRTWGSVSVPTPDVAATAKRGSSVRRVGGRVEAVEHGTATLDAVPGRPPARPGPGASPASVVDRVEPGDVLDVVDADRLRALERDVEPRRGDTDPVVAALVADVAVAGDAPAGGQPGRGVGRGVDGRGHDEGAGAGAAAARHADLGERERPVRSVGDARRPAA